MKNCPRCNAQMEDNAVFCQNCGFSVAQQAEPQAQQPQYNQYAAAPAPVVDQYDHTAEFSAEDVSENKLLAAVIYVSSVLGENLVALLTKLIQLMVGVGHILFLLRRDLIFFLFALSLT